MKTVIVNKKDLNNCWSSLQYTDSCHLCSKMEPRPGYLQCKINSKYHRNGVIKYFKIKNQQIIEAKNNSLEQSTRDERRALGLFKIK